MNVYSHPRMFHQKEANPDLLTGSGVQLEVPFLTCPGYWRVSHSHIAGAKKRPREEVLSRRNWARSGIVNRWSKSMSKLNEELELRQLTIIVQYFLLMRIFPQTLFNCWGSILEKKAGHTDWPRP